MDPWACNVCTLQHVEPLDTRLTSCRSCGTARVDARYDIDSDMDAAIALSLGLTAGTFAGASTAPALLASALPSSAATHGHSSSASAASLTSDDDVQLAIALSLSEMPTEPPKPTTSEHLAQLRAKRRATNQSKDPDRTRTPMAPGVNAAPTRITATQTRPAGLRNLPDCAASRRPAPVAAPRLVLPADPIRRATRFADPAAGRMPPATNDGADRPVQGGAAAEQQEAEKDKQARPMPTRSPYVPVPVTEHTPAFMRPFTLARQSPSQDLTPMSTTPSGWSQVPGKLMWESQVSSSRPATLAHTSTPGSMTRNLRIITTNHQWRHKMEPTRWKATTGNRRTNMQDLGC